MSSSIAEGAELTNPVRWQASVTGVPAGDVVSVRFLIDGKVRHLQREAPYLFAGRGNLLLPGTLGPGSHVFVVDVRATHSFCALVIAAAGLAAAAAPAAADASLNPTPPSWYTCQPTGSGTVCHGKMSFEDFAGIDGTCPQGFNIVENSHKDETGTRYYDRDGNLTRRVLHDVYPAGNPLNVLYNSQTGTSVPYRTDVTETDDLVVPGDFSSAISRFTGNLYTVTLPGGGLLVHDVGNFTFAPDGSILQDRGPKMLFFGQTGKLCAALA